MDTLTKIFIKTFIILGGLFSIYYFNFVQNTLLFWIIALVMAIIAGSAIADVILLHKQEQS